MSLLSFSISSFVVLVLVFFLFCPILPIIIFYFIEFEKSIVIFFRKFHEPTLFLPLSLSLNGNALISALCWNVSNSVRTSTAIVHAHTQCTHSIFYLAQFLPLESILSVRYACTSNAHCTAHSVQGMSYKFKSTPKRERNSTLETVVSTLLKEKMIMTLWFFV